MSKLAILIILSLTISFSAFAKKISFQHLLSKSLENSLADRPSQNISFRGLIPLISDIQVSLETDKKLVVDRDFSVKIKTKSFSESSFERKTYREQKLNVHLEREIVIRDHIRLAYDLFINYYHLIRLKHNYENFISLYDDQIRVIRKIGHKKTLDVESLLDAQASKTDYKIKLFGIDSRIEELLDSLSKYLNVPNLTPKNILASGVLTNKQIERYLTRYNKNPQALDNNTVMRKKISNMNLTNLNLELAKSKESHILDSVELKLGKDSSDRSEVAFEFTFSIPFMNKAVNDLNSKIVSAMKAERKYRISKLDLHEKSKMKLSDLKNGIKSYRLLKGSKRIQSAKKYLRLYKKMRGASPLTILRIKEKLLESETEMQVIRDTILRNYVDLVDMTGKLSERPLKNYLQEL